MAGGSPPCLAGRWLVNWYWQRDWQNVGWLLVGGWLGALWRQNPDSNDWLVLTDCMDGGSPLCLAGRWLVDWFLQREWECWLTVGWLDAWCFYTSKSRLKWLNWLVLTDCMAGGSPPCLAGRWLVNWYWQRDWRNVGWLLVGGLLGVFLLQNRD